MPQKTNSETDYKPGPDIHPKKYSNSGGLADWGPLLELTAKGCQKLWHRLQAAWHHAR